MSRVSDAQLQMYIDQVFGRFDRDNSGSLDSNELANFFNDLFTKMNHPKRVTYAEAQSAIQEIDIDRNGVVNKS